ncbi:type II secretion system protein N [Marinobacter sp. JSM 1782161]|uniref:type II secretion system protein N n=1 Tax=Marinobacter sp. JSM 1782161 TaxID=2685906 RepID=UPI001403F6F9|nr:type II secretion system protein N [Marinobacter sp. JSM 1782161]
MASIQGIASFNGLPRWLANLLLIGLVVYAAWFAGRLTWLAVWSDPLAPGLRATASAMASAAPGSRTPLAAYDLFGRPETGTPVAAVVKRSAPETNLRMTLEGVVVATRGADSGAIVAGTDGTTAYYHVGDIMPGDIELVEVESHRILIRRNGQVESLAFEEDGTGGMVSQSTEADYESPEAFVDDAREQLARDGDQALARYGLQPVTSGAAQGYVYDGSNPMLSALNLQSGDVITAINGQPLGDIEQDRALLDGGWREQEQIQVEVMRDGTSFTVNYALPQ